MATMGSGITTGLWGRAAYRAGDWHAAYTAFSRAGAIGPLPVDVAPGYVEVQNRLRVENDAEGATYEAHVQKSDGSQVTVKMDASYKVTSTEDGPR